MGYKGKFGHRVLVVGLIILNLITFPQLPGPAQVEK